MASRVMEDKNDAKYKRKYKSLKVQVRDAETEAEDLAKKMAKYDRRLKELKFEKSILLEKLTEMREGSPVDSDISSDEEVVVEKRRPEKDPNAPKRPANAFFMFCQLERAKMREENQDATLSDLTKLLGARWKELDNSEKEKYYRMYDQDKIRYEKEMSSYAPGNGQKPEPQIIEENFEDSNEGGLEEEGETFYEDDFEQSRDPNEQFDEQGMDYSD
ncbi:HMG-box [Neoconidiobolus thromboides FSU 785]|nr:HMG-box [Neoconidiobolus thromboides FSU 785]